MCVSLARFPVYHATIVVKQFDPDLKGIKRGRAAHWEEMSVVGEFWDINDILGSAGRLFIKIHGTARVCVCVTERAAVLR